MGYGPAWAIQLQSSQNVRQFGRPQSVEFLNGRGLYEIGPPQQEADSLDHERIQLFINSTGQENNLTLIKCIAETLTDIPVIFQTSLVVYGK